MTHRLTEELRRLAFESHDNCSVCGRTFKEGDTSHLGYDHEDNPLYACDKCASKLKETAVRHYFTPHPFEIPEETSKLWRYMDFTKYVSMLANSGLYFARGDSFEDQFEGAKGLETRKDAWDEHYLEWFKLAIRNPPPGVEWDQSEEHIESEAKRLLKDLNISGEESRKHVFINCWHENQYESEAMWQLYSSVLEQAIAIRTTFGSLYSALGKDPSIRIGRIKYIDFNSSFAGPNDSFWRKRKSFEHENEVRAVVHDHECKGMGKVVRCDLAILVEEIFISPKAPSWFVSLIDSVNQKYGLDKPINQSSLNDRPFY